jgi:hypothetical protein
VVVAKTPPPRESAAPNPARQADQAEVDGDELRRAVALGQLDDEPAEAELLHGRADVADDLAGPDQAVR